MQHRTGMATHTLAGAAASSVLVVSRKSTKPALKTPQNVEIMAMPPEFEIDPNSCTPASTLVPS